VKQAVNRKPGAKHKVERGQAFPAGGGHRLGEPQAEGALALLKRSNFKTFLFPSVFHPWLKHSRLLVCMRGSSLRGWGISGFLSQRPPQFPA
jgi:hypothetical protein